MSSATVGSIYSDAGSTRHRVRHGRIFRVVVNNSDMKKLSEVFSGYPSPVHNRRDQYPRQLDEHKKETKQIIRDLPFRLRAHKLRFGSTTMANGVVKPRQLCSTHKGLRAKLTYDVWDWVQHELDDRIGPFIYPVIMNFQLEPDVENKLRVLESVLEMYHSDFSYEAAAPPGRVPLILQDAMGPKFRYQHNQCPGCYLTRIGSDQNVCFALLVGIIARSGPSRLGRDRNHVISSRVRFLQYWLRLYRKGLELIDQAWALAGEVRDLRRAWTESQRHYIQESVRASLPVNEPSGPPVDLDRTSWNPETFAPPSDVNPPPRSTDTHLQTGSSARNRNPYDYGQYLDRGPVYRSDSVHSDGTMTGERSSFRARRPVRTPSPEAPAPPSREAPAPPKPNSNPRLSDEYVNESEITTDFRYVDPNPPLRRKTSRYLSEYAPSDTDVPPIPPLNIMQRDADNESNSSRSSDVSIVTSMLSWQSLDDRTSTWDRQSRASRYANSIPPVPSVSEMPRIPSTLAQNLPTPHRKSIYGVFRNSDADHDLYEDSGDEVDGTAEDMDECAEADDWFDESDVGDKPADHSLGLLSSDGKRSSSQQNSTHRNSLQRNTSHRESTNTVHSLQSGSSWGRLM